MREKCICAHVSYGLLLTVLLPRQQKGRTSSVAEITLDQSGGTGFLFGEVAVVFTRNPKAKCLVFPCKLFQPFVLHLATLLSAFSFPLLSNLSFGRLYKKLPARI
jgi:hypothetical protein